MKCANFESMRLPRSPRFWLAGFLLWFSALYLLSSLSVATDYRPPINQFDKIAHFGYFFGGSGLLCAYLYRRKPTPTTQWKSIITTAVVVIAIVGMLDEYHQSFTPGRSGNDPYDWLADVIGAMVGALVFKRFHYLLK
jgi:VanZ family protein